ncbi:MAG: T9SS type A sorting domain-containing protein [Flavobacteriales bacterium]|nr:T9SS type A sorting domain-containing protein [Flavobacteriales bacterium]
MAQDNLWVNSGSGQLLDFNTGGVQATASSYATMAYGFKATPDKAYLSIRDAVGKELQRLPIQAAEGQTVWDTRSISPGAYTVELVNGGRTLGTAKLIVKR